MTTTGNVNITVTDNGTNIVVPAVSVQVVIGPASTGPVATILSTRSPSTIQSTNGYGPMPEYAALAALNGGTMLLLRSATTTPGSVNGSATAIGGGVSGAASGTGGLVKITTTSAHGLITGDVVTIASVTGTTEANGTWIVGTIVDSTDFLIPVTFVNAWVSGGTVTFVGACWSSTALSPGTATCYPDSTCVPLDTYYAQLTCTRAGIVNGTGGALSVSSTASAGGLIKITTSAAHKLTTGAIVTIAGVTGTVEANGTWTITVVDSTHFDLNGSVYTNAWVSGGTVTFVGPTVLFTLSLDANRNVGPNINLGAANSFALTNTGCLLDFTPGTFAVGDVVRFSTTGPASSAANVEACFAALQASQYAAVGWGSLKVIGTVNGAYTSALESGSPGLDQLAAGYVFTRAQTEARDITAPAAWGGARPYVAETEAQWMSSIEADFSAALNRRVLASAGHYNMPSAYPTLLFGTPAYRRPLCWAQAVRELQIPPQRHSGRVSDGALATIVVNPLTDPTDGFLYHDERINPGLDYLQGGVGRFCSATTRIGLPGWYIVNPLLLSPMGSTFYMLPLGAVMDIACDIVHTIGQQEIDEDVRTNPNGTIYVNDANTIQSAINTGLSQQMTSVNMISGASVAVDMTNNVQATQTVNIAVTIQSRGYVLQENVSIGFGNAAAA